jgi:hypothetical protein
VAEGGGGGGGALAGGGGGATLIVRGVDEEVGAPVVEETGTFTNSPPSPK